MNKKKTIAVAIVLALILLIGGMLAFYTDTDEKSNVFTLGNKVNITLTETWTASNGQNILPGAEVTKEPSIKNENDSSPAYVFAEVTVPNYTKNGATTTTPLFTYNVNSGWAEIKTEDVTGGIKHVYAYGSTSEMTTLAINTTTSTPVFSKVKLDETIKALDTVPTNTQIDVKAYGIQSSNLTKSDGTQASTPAEIFALFTNN